MRPCRIIDEIEYSDPGVDKVLRSKRPRRDSKMVKFNPSEVRLQSLLKTSDSLLWRHQNLIEAVISLQS